MPKFELTCRVSASMPYVWKRFTADLLAKLAPPFPIARIIRFDGCQANDHVMIELDFLVAKTVWTSIITSYQFDGESHVFVDEGIKVPFGIVTWRHEHRIEVIGEKETRVIDRIQFQTNYKLLDLLLFPLLWGMIAYRMPLYKKYLRQPKTL
jgi:ligand-binding SRPBCC domain-containing protein